MKRKEEIVEKIQDLIHEIVDYTERPLLNLSVHITRELGLNYTYLSNTFSEVTNITIERFYIQTKIEKAKLMLRESDMDIQEVAHHLHYCSKAHFSSQFKFVTGINPSEYRRKHTPMKTSSRKTS